VIQMIEEMVRSRRPHYFVTPNVDFLVQARHDIELRRILFDAHLVLCDGTPLLWASRLLGNPLRERVAGSDLVPLLIRVAAEQGYRIFFLGGSPDTTAQAVERLRTQFPAGLIAGYYSPPFSELLEMNHDEIKQRIREAHPDLLFVSFGCPKQEKWIAMHHQSLGVPVSAGVGGTIDFLAGRLSRAPQWMRRGGMEWLFRLGQEPRRLSQRYVRDLVGFAWGFATQWWCLRFFRPQRRTQSPDTGLNEEGGCQRGTLPARLDMETVERSAHLWTPLMTGNQPVLLNVNEVEFIDSTGVALLIRLQKRARQSGQSLILVGNSASVQRALRTMRLEAFFTFAASEAEALQLLERVRHFEPAVVRSDAGTLRQRLHWRGEITTATAPGVWQATEAYLLSRAGCQSELGIDLGEVRFIDSTGVGLMVRAKKCATRAGSVMKFTGAQPTVRNVIQLCRLEAFLFGTCP
ncbi:MAG: WecB/TagA/CpsF family glycosyltransferase, partial [Verrucomicrobiales bacterium]|nr:WecB/TagA/CpsF family glycosyltransferase [Verrucomicrobiales bacterium]